MERLVIYKIDNVALPARKKRGYPLNVSSTMRFLLVVILGLGLVCGES